MLYREKKEFKTESKKILKQIEDLTNELNDLSTLIDNQTKVDNLDYLNYSEMVA